MKMHEIRAIAKKMGINSFGKSKVELVRDIQRNEGNFDCYGTAVDEVCDQASCLWRDDCFVASTAAAKAV